MGIDNIKWIVVVLTTIPLMIAAHKGTDGEAIGIGESYALSLGFFWRYIWTSFLYSLIAMGMFLLIIPVIWF